MCARACTCACVCVCATDARHHGLHCNSWSLTEAQLKRLMVPIGDEEGDKHQVDAESKEEHVLHALDRMCQQVGSRGTSKSQGMRAFLLIDS